MRQLLPAGESYPTTELSDERLRKFYEYPQALNRPWLRVNFVSSIDGAVTVDGRTAEMATPADQRVFALLRELADVIVVGAGTARAEGYGGARFSPAQRGARVERGQAPVPPIAVITASARLEATSALLTATEVAPLILTTERSDPGRTEALQAAGATVLPVGESVVDPQAALETLGDRGLVRVLCEGGPTLFGQLIGADLVDDLCLTTAPVLAPGTAGRITAGPTLAPRRMRLAHVLTDTDGTLLTRWLHP